MAAGVACQKPVVPQLERLGEPPASDISSMAELADSGVVIPDGICLDAEGAIWVANPYGKEVLYVREGGEVTDRIVLSTGVTACMLGGQDRRMLFITVPGRPGTDGSPATGCLVTVHVNVPGAGLP